MSFYSQEDKLEAIRKIAKSINLPISEIKEVGPGTFAMDTFHSSPMQKVAFTILCMAQGQCVVQSIIRQSDGSEFIMTKIIGHLFLIRNSHDFVFPWETLEFPDMREIVELVSKE